jgi:hypothetical protein
MQSTSRLLRQAALAAKIGIGFTIAICALACGSSGNPGPGSPSYKTGALGNGGFTFRCDDSVACDRWSNSAEKFPTKVAAGSTFELNFFLKDESTGVIRIQIDQPPESRGIRLEGVKAFADKDPNGKFAVTKAGVATFMARDGKGWVVDYTTIQVFQPDGLVVYDASYRGNTPPRVQSVNLRKADRRSYRAVGEIGKEPLAGSFNVDWKSNDPSIVDIETTTGGTATIIAKGVGQTKLIAEGGAAHEEISVEVTQ